MQAVEGERRAVALPVQASQTQICAIANPLHCAVRLTNKRVTENACAFTSDWHSWIFPRVLDPTIRIRDAFRRLLFLFINRAQDPDGR
jgi:hypothetical protein